MKFRQLHSEGGDCTAPYEVTDFKAKTVGEFVNEVVASRQKEWGTISVKHDGMFCGPKICEYRYGKVLGKIDDVFRDREIEPTVFASGGWSNMDYKLKLKETMETMGKKTENVKDLYWKDGNVFVMSDGSRRFVWGENAIDSHGSIPKKLFDDGLKVMYNTLGEHVIAVYAPYADAGYFDELAFVKKENLLWQKYNRTITEDDIREKFGLAEDETFIVV